jgi:two-component system nitrate/nitrite response regulator NarL
LVASTARITVVIGDDHPFYRDGVRRGLIDSGRITVLAEASDGRETLDAIREHHPNVALIDYQMPELDGLAVLHAVVRDALPTKVVLLTAAAEPAIAYAALAEGAAGFVPKDARRDEIVDAIVRAAAGHIVVPTGIGAAVAAEIRLRASDAEPVLSPREREVLAAFARGLSIPQVAAELVIGVNTVKTHAARLYQKLAVSDRAAAVAEAMRRGLIE